MFIKPFKIKSNVQLRGSDLKKFRQRIEKEFPNTSEVDLQNLLPSKSALSQIKLFSHSGIPCTVFAVDKRPLFFEDEHNELIPTIYALWIAPEILPYFTTHTAVLPKLAKGADLLLPGVIRQESGMNAYGRYKKFQLVAVNLTSNKSAVGVGRLGRSSEDLYMAGGRGICVKMLHVFGDKLWSIEPSVVLQIPKREPVLQVPDDDDFPELGATDHKKSQKQESLSKEIVVSETEEDNDFDNDEKTIDDIITNQKETAEGDNVQESCVDVEGNQNLQTIEAESMDSVLKNAFFKALKFDGKSLTLPLLTSNFYRLHVIPAATKQIDLKQTSYKKISKFLNEMMKEGFIEVKEETKGIEKITSINLNHPIIVNFIPPEDTSTSNNDKTKEIQLFHSQMTELYVITDETLPLFTKLNYKKNDGIPAIQIKKLIKEYVSKNQLQTIDNATKTIKLDSVLSNICETENATVDQIYHDVLEKMHYTFGMRNTGNINCSNLTSNRPPIQMSLATRSGNKKVTLVSNLEAYGIIISEFSKACKIGAAASTSMVKTPHSKIEQLQIQGNQIRFIYNLLTETYKIPPKQISGLDLAKKEKKKKN